MGFSSWVKKQFEDTPEKKAKRREEREHKAEVKKAYLEAYYKAELEAATEQGKLAGKNAKINSKNNGLLSTIGRAAEGAMKGINQGADMFNKGMGAENIELKNDSNQLVLPNLEEVCLPKGNNDLFFDDEPKPKKRRYERDW